ncbi:MAG: hypothetical protein H5U37_06815, partial [Caldisericia bacterium]|nr:hypothetical protein [Caldisericia bacterium]
MRKILNEKGFALITVFMVSVILVGIIGFTFVSVNRQLNLKNINLNSKKSFTVADAGLEQMINQVQNYHFFTLPEYLVFEVVLGEPIINQLKQGFTSLNISACQGLSSDDANKIQNAINNSFSNYISKGQYFYDFYGYNSLTKKLLDASQNTIDIDNSPDLGLVKLSQRLTLELQSFSQNILNTSFSSDCSTCVEAIIEKIKEDIENSYNQWALYVKDKMNALIIEMGGLTGNSPNCPTENLDNIIVPYDIDYPVVDENQISYEGVILRTASEVEIYHSDIDVYPTRKLIISAVSYVFDKQVPKTTYEAIKNYLALVCPREEDAEYKKYPLKGTSNSYPQINEKIYINALDVDKTNQNLKEAGYSIELTPIKRGIRAEFQIPFIIGENEPEVNLFTIPGTVVRWTPSGEDLPPPPPPSQIYPYNYPYYIIATNNNITLPSSEHIYGPVRTNNRVYFYGETNDVIIARREVDYKGKFKF